MPDLLDIMNTLTEDGGDGYDTFGNTKPWDDHDYALLQAESEITASTDEEIVNTERPKHTRNNFTLLSFDFN
jgi:hypothetical protein